MKGKTPTNSRSAIFDNSKLSSQNKMKDQQDYQQKDSLLDFSAYEDYGHANKLSKKKSQLESMTKIKSRNIPQDEDISELTSPKTSKSSQIPQQLKKPQFSKAFLDDFKKYIEYRQQKKNQQKSQMQSLVFSDLSTRKSQTNIPLTANNHNNNNNNSSNNNNKTEQNDLEDAMKQEYQAKVQKHKDQTKKIMLEINKKLKIQAKSKQERFEDQMQVFKNTDTYIEIKPFLEQLNKVNHSKFIQQIARYENNIKQAQEYQQEDDLFRNSNSDFYQKFYANTPKRNEELSMRKFEDLLTKAQSYIIHSNNLQSYKFLQNSIIQRLMEELGYFDPNISSSDSQQQKENVSDNFDFNSQLNDQSTNKDTNPNRKYSKYAEKEQQKSDQINELPKIKRKPSLQLGDLTSDDNQFFINLKNYLNKAQKDINLKLELETEQNTYAQVIQENQRKIEEAKQEQIKRFLGGKLNPQNLLEGDRDVQLKEYYERFRLKAEQVRSTLHKVNQQLFQKKWANAQIKRQMQRQRERNQLLSQFKNNKINSDELLNPSKRMNEKLLRKKQNQNDGISQSQSKAQQSHNSLNDLSVDQQYINSHDSYKNRNHEIQSSDDQNIYLTAPVEIHSQQPLIKSTPNSMSQRIKDFSHDNKLKTIQEKINNNSNNSFNLPLIHSTKNLQSSHMLSPNKFKQNEFGLQVQTNKQSMFDKNNNSSLPPQVVLNIKSNNGQTPQSILSKRNSASTNFKANQQDSPTKKKNSILFSQRSPLFQQIQTEEEQNKIEQIIQEIDEEHNEYIQEKSNIKSQLELISLSYDKEMSKYQKNDNIDSIRGIQSDIPQHEYHSGLKIFQRQSRVSRF
ncbi:hypothetical protein TTHERM_01307970 (macronuclear) [Tetrahymena thermophila SB210]|uniref:Uncharacterized protein n=1 Tax=Tetrahymena thermophila (strain SB210) TaxID=312017 RepID=Q229Z8_TETTS|nr:hypothetical protein TTHERM_01307970 [Tetrahymena thermophila SB210]EAR82113.2 hypothetical protein TTHERM_01307970 [Tetrahymena thermophila SB210]|eukprot:XP_001029776.2 hypothetical protein TTHERM_01307970 [Tetrahymena thermophila SB210]